MKIKLMLSVFMVCFVAATVSAATVTVDASADTYIQYLDTSLGGGGPQDINFGTDATFTTKDKNGDKFKAYLQFDASAYASGDISEITSISMFYTGSKNKNVGVWLLLPDQGIDNNWTETGITWVNAPYNDGSAYTDRGFNNNGALNETVYDLSGGGNGWIISTGWNTFTFDHLDALNPLYKPALLAALTSGDQKVTFGLSQDDGMIAEMLSREYVDDGTIGTIGDTYAPTMSIVVPEPATLVLLGLGSLSLLRKRK